MEDKCAYCGKSLTEAYTFSYGIPGKPRVYVCNRESCMHNRIKVTLTKKDLNNLYTIAYKAGHNDTVESQYIDVLSCDIDTYWQEEVDNFLKELE